MFKIKTLKRLRNIGMCKRKTFQIQKQKIKNRKEKQMLKKQKTLQTEDVFKFPSKQTDPSFSSFCLGKIPKQLFQQFWDNKFNSKHKL